MNDEQIAQMGNYAKQVLDNPAFQEALSRVQELARQAFIQTPIRDAEGLKLARQFQAVTDDFETVLKRMVEGGKYAKLQLDKHRDESTAKRAMRKLYR